MKKNVSVCFECFFFFLSKKSNVTKKQNVPQSHPLIFTKANENKTKRKLESSTLIENDCSVEIVFYYKYNLNNFKNIFNLFLHYCITLNNLIQDPRRFS